MMIGAARGSPIVIADARTLQDANKTIEDNAIARVLDKSGIVDHVDRRQKIVALMRAYDQAVAP